MGVINGGVVESFNNTLFNTPFNIPPAIRTRGPGNPLTSFAVDASRFIVLTSSSVTHNVHPYVNFKYFNEIKNMPRNNTINTTTSPSSKESDVEALDFRRRLVAGTPLSDAPLSASVLVVDVLTAQSAVLFLVGLVGMYSREP